MERHFSEKQDSDIIRKAADRQARADTPGPAPSGISESELRRVAKELGIDEDALFHAMSEVGASTLSDTGTIRSFERTLERTIDGDVPEEALAYVIEEFVPVAGLQANTVTIGRAINYTSMVRLGQCNVNVAPRNGKTVLRVKSQTFLAAFPTFLPAFIASIGASAGVWEGMSADTPTKIAVHVLLLGGIWTVATLGYRSMIRETNRKVLELTDRTAAKLAEAAQHLRSRLGRAPEVGVERVVEQEL